MIPDLGDLKQRSNNTVVANPPSEGPFYANDVGIGVNADGSLALDFRYLVASESGTRTQATKTIVIPTMVLLGPLLNNLPGIVKASAESARAAAAQLASFAGGPREPDDELRSARRAAAGDGDET